MLTSKTLYVGIEQVQKLIEKDDKPISQKEAAKQEKKIQKIISKRRSESVRVLIHSPSVLWTRQKLYQAKYSARTRVPGRDDGHRRGKTKMSQNRLHLRTRPTLLVALAIALSSAFAQPSTTRTESVVVFAPHPDDEVIGCAGIIQQAVARRARVTVVDITSGDGFDAAAAGVTHKSVDKVGPEDFFALSRLRQSQSRNALEILGGTANDLIILGYPDGDLGNLYESRGDETIRQQFTRKDETYALIQMDYHTSVHGKPAPYNRSSVLGDLAELLKTLQPTELYVTDETDGHIDHRAVFWFVREAAKQVGYNGAFYTYLVHGLPAWPFPPGVTPNQPFESRKVKGEVAPRDLPWPPPKRVPLTLEQAQRKLKSIQAHNIPVVGMPDHQGEMESFVKSEEVFWTPLAHNQ